MDDNERKETLGRAQALLLDMMPEPGMLQTAISGVSCGRSDACENQGSSIADSFISLLVQGCKQTWLPGSGRFNYTSGQCMISAVSSPSTVKFENCTAHEPLLYMHVMLNYSIIDELLREDPSLRRSHLDNMKLCSACIIDADAALIGAFLRLFELTRRPERIKIMAPLILKEIHYYALLSKANGILVDYASSGGLHNQIAKAAAFLKDNYNKTVFVNEVASLVNMAPSTFFRHFKGLIGVTPMQYLKQLRLHAARSMLLHEACSVSQVAYDVGYESPSQFSRDYKKLFGLTPTCQQTGSSGGGRTL